MSFDPNKPSLTRGLDAILKLHPLPTLSQTTPQPIESEIYRDLALDALTVGKFQPRRKCNPDEIDALAKSIASQGILQPLIVRPIEEHQFEIIAGERRWRAARQLGLLTVPVIIKHVPDQVAAAFSLVENIQRKDLNALDEAHALQRLHHEFCLSHDEIAECIGRSRTHVTNMLRLLTLDEEVKRALEEELISMGHARALLTLTHNEQQKLCADIIKKELSVRATEERVRENRPFLGESTHVSIEDKELLQWRESLEKKFQVNFTIRALAADKYHVVMKANSRQELEALILNLNSFPL